MTIKLIPRLIHTLNISKRTSYVDEISKDYACIKLQEKNNIGRRNINNFKKKFSCYSFF